MLMPVGKDPCKKGRGIWLRGKRWGRASNGRAGAVYLVARPQKSEPADKQCKKRKTFQPRLFLELHVYDSFQRLMQISLHGARNLISHPASRKKSAPLLPPRRDCGHGLDYANAFYANCAAGTWLETVNRAIPIPRPCVRVESVRLASGCT